MRICSNFGRVCGLAAVALMGAGVAQAQPWIVDQEQALENAYMVGFFDRLGREVAGDL